MIIARKLMAKAARDQGLDKTPTFAMQELRMRDSLLAQDVQAKFASEVPPPTREEAEQFVANNTDIFDQRKIFTVDQIRMPRPSDPKLLQAIQPLNTLADIESLLTSQNVPFQTATDTIDAVGTDPRLIGAIVKLPPNEVFILPSGNTVLINQIKGTKVVPFTGEPAITYALNLLKRQRIQQAVGKQVHSILTSPSNVISYNPAYQPPKPSPPPAPTSSAPVSAAPAISAAPASGA